MLLSSGAAAGPVYPVTGKVNLMQEAVMEGTKVSNTPFHFHAPAWLGQVLVVRDPVKTPVEVE